ncbi:hypothetical protein TBK1r_22120 [Stieleria magnilauensis]|uniref:Uncharacterized protein n=1 Tax=Stieleria magnilauensis TaxID=2527963 RepID=A0ABX5XN77_9BACT|nr:hypothetical protein TBK1r_22120 [Planctomycetes bacterium TBK1r]
MRHFRRGKRQLRDRDAAAWATRVDMVVEATGRIVGHPARIAEGCRFDYCRISMEYTGSPLPKKRQRCEASSVFWGEGLGVRGNT